MAVRSMTPFLQPLIFKVAMFKHTCSLLSKLACENACTRENSQEEEEEDTFSQCFPKS